MHPLVYTTPISKTAYLGGRFPAAFVLNALILLAVPLGMLTNFLWPGVTSEIVGPFPPAVYLSSYCVLALPTAITFTAVQFSLAALTRRAIVSYLGTVLFFVTAGATVGVAATAVALIVTLGGFIFYNTNSLNRYLPRPRSRSGAPNTSGATESMRASRTQPSRALHRELQAVTSDSYQYLLGDLFEKNTFWEFETQRATAQQTGAGAWQVTLDVQARKVVVDEVVEFLRGILERPSPGIY